MEKRTAGRYGAVRRLAAWRLSYRGVCAVTILDPTDGKPGLRIETAASVMAADMMAKHLATFKHVIQKDRHSGAAVVAAYIEGLACVVALTIAGKHGSYWEVLAATEQRLRDEVDKLLKLMRPT